MKNKHFNITNYKNLTKDILTAVINITLVLFVLNLLSINFGIFESHILLVFSICLLLGLILFNLPLKRFIFSFGKTKSKRNDIVKMLFGLFLMIFSFALLLFIQNQMLQIASISVMVSSLDLILQGMKIRKKELFIMSISSFVYALFFIFIKTVPFVWYILQRFSLSFSRFLGFLTGKSLLLGPSISGLWIMLVFLIFSSTLFVYSFNRKYLRSCLSNFVVTVVGLFVCWITYMLIFSFIDFKAKEEVVNLQFVIFLLYLVPIFYHLSKTNLRDSILALPQFKNLQFKKIVKNGVLWTLILIFISAILLTSFLNVSSVSSSKKTVLFYGQNMLGSWDVPEYGKYGKEGVGMFGLLPIYLNASGYKTEIVTSNRSLFLNASQPNIENITRYINLTDYVDILESSTITNDVLKDVDVFVVINLNVSFSDNEKEAIWNFVRNGGSLLVLGDHTNVGGILDPLNALLMPVSVKYNFDSALPLDSTHRWTTCYDLPYHPITSHIEGLDELQISVGASLDIDYNCFPIVVGRFAFADAGNHSNRDIAFLGDYDYTHGEHMGDVVLVAGSYYGDGKVLVFGDTSSFQNSAIPYSYHFVQDCFSWLNSEDSSNLEFLQDVSAFVFILVAIFVYIFIYSKSAVGKSSFSFIAVSLCIALLISISINPMLVDLKELKQNSVIIDASHNERFNLEAYTDDSLNGFMLNLIRNSYLPIIEKKFTQNEFDTSKIIAFNAPTKQFSNSEIHFLKNYMKNGGVVLLATGYEDKYASYNLLEEFNLNVENIPLGPVPYIENNSDKYQNKPRFVDSWPISFYKNQENIISYYNFTVAGWESEFNLIVFVKHGKGGLLLISDSQFLLDKNIESIYDYWPGNILLLKYLIDEFKTMGAEE